MAVEIDEDVQTVVSTNKSMFETKGLNLKGENRGCGFHIELDSEFAKILEDMEVPEKQDTVAETLDDMFLDDMFSEVRFKGESFLISSIRVSGNASDLNYYRDRGDCYIYHTHNIDTARQAIEIISVFSYWVKLARLVVKDKLGDDLEWD